MNKETNKVEMARDQLSPQYNDGRARSLVPWPSSLPLVLSVQCSPLAAMLLSCRNIASNNRHL